MWCCRNTLEDSWSDFHFPHWENNNNLLLPFVSNHLAIYPWRNFLSHPAAIFLLDLHDRILESPLKRNRQMLNCVPLAGRSWAPFSYMCRELYVAIKGKGLEKNRSMFISLSLELKVKPQSLRPGPSHPQTTTCVLTSSALFCCCACIEQKCWSLWSFFAPVTVIGFYLISSAFSFLHECTACSAPPLDGQVAHSHERAAQVIEVSSHLNQDHPNAELVQHKGLLSLYSSPFPPAALPVSSFQVKKCQNLPCPEEGDTHPLEETERGEGEQITILNQNHIFQEESF